MHSAIFFVDESGIQLFTFNGNVNRNIRIDQSGSISGEVYRATSGRWVFEDSRTSIQGSDTLRYWLYVQFDGASHKKEGVWTKSGGIKMTHLSIRRVSIKNDKLQRS